MTFAHAMPFGAELRGDGVRFSLWAPSRSEVRVDVDGAEHALDAAGDGWFRGDVPHARARSRYRFAFDGSGLRVPDPASRFQPDGVHGASQVVDPRAYRWRTEGWCGRPWHESVVYELHVGTFTPEGTYRGAIARLDALVDLGITAIELMPLAQPAGDRNWGYDGTLLYAPQRAYGTPHELKELIDAAHERGLTVLLDAVYNHFGPEGNYLHAYAAPFFTERRGTPWGAAIDFDGAHAATVRDFFVQNALYWLLEYRFDGLRLDAVHEIFSEAQPHVLDEIALRVRAGVEPDRIVHLVIENDANRASLLDRYDAQWNDDAHHALHVLVTGERDGYYRDYADAPARHLARALDEGFAYQGEPSPHRGGAPRGEPSAHRSASAFVDFLQNHDQVGNRALGERISAIATFDAVAAAASIVLLAPAVPLLFMGEEWAASTPFCFFTDFGPELGAAVTEGRRREFAAWPSFADPASLTRIPDPQDPQTMRGSVLRWDERTQAPHAAMLAHYRALLDVRRRLIAPHLRSGAYGDGSAVFGRALRVRWRFGDGARITLLANLSDTAATIPAGAEGTMLSSLAEIEAGDAASHLGPWAVGWYLSGSGVAVS
ncbi:malto-oligosyltrehalose trehalohydrolase [Vulcanimicrobium alpinum]|uniref:Malto-oligosyltrehalose trehalohydrolase n=1 Tax=Vulcanimicrobium alpinum TaxID=3016050 RepID=A0AAN2C8Y8_UNVUL|nr:malto-oligosyltrehalose trehalohydrolase [Vulcanimicrobium alpinum]BDE05428.1 malto-oligosyltrehalose trehalohydrolase [Vulcanimicrobium alpinum]